MVRLLDEVDDIDQDEIDKEQRKKKRYGKARRQNRAQANRDNSKAVAEIGELPDVVDPERKARCEFDLLEFLITYFPDSTGLSPFSPKQIEVIQRIERCVLKNGRVLNLMPRGFVKSTISENAILWMTLYGHRRYVLFMGATDDDAATAIESIKEELEENDLLAEDFPEVCAPIRELEGKSMRCISQTQNGERTKIKWSAGLVVFPSIYEEGELAQTSGVRIASRGLLSSMRGVRFKTKGRQVRPDFVVIDDPQTDESARNSTQVQLRKKKIRKSICRLGGHGNQVSIVINATVIEPDDLVDQLGDHQEHAEWQAVRVAMVKKLPTKLKTLWLVNYAKIRRDYDPMDIDGPDEAKERATEYYFENQEEMDAGSECEWENIGLEDDEISALQHAINILIDDGEETFQSECQNNPQRLATHSTLNLTRGILRNKLNGIARGLVPDGRGTLTFHVDVHDNLLYWSVFAVGSDFTGSLLSFGTWPEQPILHFSLNSAPNKLRNLYPEDDVEERIRRGICDLIRKINAMEFRNHAGSLFGISGGSVDAGYKPECAAAGIKRSGFTNVVTAKGLAPGLKQRPVPQYDMSAARVIKCGPIPTRPRWYFPREFIVDGVQRVHFDANWFKAQICARIIQTKAEGAWRLFGLQPDHVDPVIEHYISESPEQRSDGLNTITVFTQEPSKGNHWFDNMIGAAVMASVHGCQMLDVPKVDAPPPPPPPVAIPTRENGLSFFITSR